MIDDRRVDTQQEVMRQQKLQHTSEKKSRNDGPLKRKIPARLSWKKTLAVGATARRCKKKKTETPTERIHKERKWP